MSRRNLFAALLLGAIATSLVGCNSGDSSVTSPVDLSPPQAPTNLHSTTDANISRDWLVWDLSASANVSGYEVYSASSVGGTGQLIATVDASTSDYLLPITGAGPTEFYRLRAVGTNHVPSAFTSTLGVVRTGWSGAPLPGTPDEGRGLD